MKNVNPYKVAFEGLLLTASLVLLFSALSFNIADAPSDCAWPHNTTPVNWCGRAGAFLAYYMMYYIGPGVYLALFASAWLLAAHLVGVQITQPVFRAIGMLLMVAATSASFYLLWPEKNVWPYTSGSFYFGNGGVLGIAAGAVLYKHLAGFGAAVVLVCAWFVGAVLLADTAVLAIIRGFGHIILKFLGLAGPAFSAAKEHSQTLANIWTKLSQRQKKADSGLREFKLNSQARTAPVAEPAPFVSSVAPSAAGTESAVRQTTPAKSAPAKTEEKAQPHAASKDKSGRKDDSQTSQSWQDYQLPPLDLLQDPVQGFAAVQEKMVENKARVMEGLLNEFNINAQVVSAEAGPAITMYELELAPGVKVSQISNLANDMARALGSGSVRVVAPLPGKHTIGIEVPNSQRETVRLKELLIKGSKQISRMQIPLFLGKSSSGEALVSDLASMPHLLIAGTTGSGKSVCINSIIASIMLTRRPDDVKLVLIDPKMVEMAVFEMIPHLMCPIVTETRKAEQILEWATTTMDERYELLAEARVRNITSYNMLTPEQLIEAFQPASEEEGAKIPKKLPHIVVIIDELADLMMTSAKEVEAYIVRIAQKSRAVGIHLVVATQRPQATVVTGLIKSNMPCRIGFRVAARMDSRIILDQNGAETLLGQGDMLFLLPGTSDLVRAQGAYLDDEEIRRIVDFLKETAAPQFHPDLMQLNRIDFSESKKDDLFDQAVRVVIESKRGSVSLLQRRLSVGYARASRMIEMMASAGVLGEYKGSQAREILMNIEEYEAVKKNMIADEVAGYADLTEQADQDEDHDSPSGELDDEKDED